MFSRARVSSAQRPRSLVQTAVFALVAFTVIATVTSVKHLASAIASRHGLAHQGITADISTDSGAHKRLQHLDDGLDSRARWVGDNSVGHLQSSTRSAVQPGKTRTAMYTCSLFGQDSLGRMQCLQQCCQAQHPHVTCGLPAVHLAGNVTAGTDRSPLADTSLPLQSSNSSNRTDGRCTMLPNTEYVQADYWPRACCVPSAAITSGLGSCGLSDNAYML